LCKWDCSAGSSLLVPSGPSGNHLHIILNNPTVFEGYTSDHCVLVGVSTIRNAPYDETCTIEPGKHSFIVEPSFVTYRHARVETANKLLSFVETQYFIPRDPVDNELLAEITAGIYKSKHTPNFIKQLLI